MNRIISFVKFPIHFWKKHKVWSGIFIVGIVLLILIFRPKPPIPPSTQQVQKTNLIQTVSVSGTVDASEKANLTFPIAGKLIWLGAKEGEGVKKYQTIAVLDQRTLEQNLLNAQKALDNQQITFDITNDANGDRLLNDLSLSTSALRQLKQATSTLDQSKIALTIQQIAKEQSVLVSPIDGIVTHEDVKIPGVNVTTTNTFTIINPNTLIFTMDVDEADVAKVATGDAVKITLDPYPNSPMTLPINSIDFVSHATTNGGNAFTVKVLLPKDAQYNFRVGMNGNADIRTAEKDNVLTIPIAAISDDNSVYVKKGKGYKKVKVVLGLQSDVNAEIISGLQEGDLVVLDPSKVPSKQIIR